MGAIYRDYLYFDGLRPGNQKLPDNIENIEVNNVNLVENTKAEYIKEKDQELLMKILTNI